MPKILSFKPNHPELEKENPIKSLWEEFLSLDKFTKLFIISYLLIIFATTFTVANYQIFNVRGESGSQRLKSIAQLQEFQQQFTNLSSSTAQVAKTPVPTPSHTASPLETIFTFFVNGINYLLKAPISFFQSISIGKY